MPEEEILNRIFNFLSSVDIPFSFGEVSEEKEFLPGLCIQRSGLLIDNKKLKYPGDILHEAGHLAVSPPSKRKTLDGKLPSGGDQDISEEMMAIAWSFAAALHIGIDPLIVFHEHGYKGGGQSIVENFNNGRFFGVSMLQWTGMSYEEKKAAELGAEPYPKMIRWIREFESPVENAEQ